MTAGDIRARAVDFFRKKRTPEGKRKRTRKTVPPVTEETIVQEVDPDLLRQGVILDDLED